ncbi:MAG: tol-pal system protein YbgF [Alphaproteobacteria bacterium]|nr:tol-pal system protein YbgF [Alphaproteobacteria bacterium]
MMQSFASTDRLKARFILGLLVMGFGVLTLGFTADAQAQSNRDLRNRIDRLEKEIETLSRALFRGEQPPAGSLTDSSAADASRADAEIRLSQVEGDIRKIRGQFEELSYENRQLREELDRLKSDLELRIQDLEKGNSAGGSSRSSGAAKYINRTSDAPDSDVEEKPAGYQWKSGNLDDDTPSAQPGQLGTYREGGGNVTAGEDLAAATYENAFSMLKNEKYDIAQKEFTVFLDEYPDHPLAGNAKYWLGETYYVRGDFERAARLFAEGFKLYPKNSKSADNLLKLGMSLAALDKKDDACVALSQISKEGFQASAPVIRRANQEKERLGC